MMNPSSSKNLHERIAAWSDAHLAEARAFVQSYAELIPRDLSNAQLYGLANVARSVKQYADLAAFLKNQMTKAERSGKSKMQDCWQRLNTKLTGYRAEAANITHAAGLRPDQVDAVHLQLAQRFVQHLIAESLVSAKSNDRNRKNR
ncbi:hypothetical protein L0337_10745 [candidate division KSB1 bacterium]|nr:hypothetical protein [candidate division KSB1 bacterium]